MIKNKIHYKVFILISIHLLASCGIKKYNNQPNVSNQNNIVKIENEKLATFIQEWIGVKHKLGGNDKNGMDCSSFSQLLEKTVFNTNINRIAKDQALQIDEKEITELIEGDLLFFSFIQNGNIDHVGVYLNNDFFVHTSTSRGVVIDNLRKNYIKYLVKSGSIKPIFKQ